MLESLRGTFVRIILGRIVRGLEKSHVSPHALSILSLVIALSAGYTYAIKDPFFPYVTVLLLIGSGLFDVLDGELARAMGKESKLGAFLDSNFDRISETAIYTGILMGRYVEEFLVLLALAFSLIVSYERARAESLGVSLRGVGIGERAERILVLIISTALARVDLGVILVVILTFITMIHRLIYGAGSFIRIARVS